MADAAIVLRKTLAHIAGGYADDVIFTRIVGRGTSEEVDPDAALLQIGNLSGRGLPEDVLKKLCTAGASFEGGACDDLVQMPLQQRLPLSRAGHLCDLPSDRCTSEFRCRTHELDNGMLA